MGILEYDCIIKLFSTVPTSAGPQHCHSTTQRMQHLYVPSANDIKKKKQPDYHLYATLLQLPNPFNTVLSHLHKYIY